MSIFIHEIKRNIILKETTRELLEHFGVKLDDGFLKRTPPPKKYSIRKKMSPVRDQGSLGACTAFCVAALGEYYHKVDLSEGQISHESEKEYDDCSEGLALVHAMRTVLSPGAVNEKWWPYDSEKVCWRKPPKVSGKRRYKFRGITYLYQTERELLIDRLRKGQLSKGALPSKSTLIKHSLVARGPVAISVPVFWEAGWSVGPDIKMPKAQMIADYLKAPNPKEDGWHCIAICGFNDSKKRFTFKNSWDTWWGDDGYGTLPYKYVDSLSDVAMAAWK